MNESSLLAKLLYKCHMVSRKNCVKGKNFCRAVVSNEHGNVYNKRAIAKEAQNRSTVEPRFNELLHNYMSSVQRTTFLAPVIV